MPEYCVWNNDSCSTSPDLSSTLAEAVNGLCALVRSQLACVQKEVVPTYCTWRDGVCSYKSGFFEENDSFYQSACAALTSSDMCSYTNDVCTSGHIRSETGECVSQPWYDWKSCSEEMNQGACPDGADPNPAVYQICPYTCARFTLKRLAREQADGSDGGGEGGSAGGAAPRV